MLACIADRQNHRYTRDFVTCLAAMQANMVDVACLWFYKVGMSDSARLKVSPKSYSFLLGMLLYRNPNQEWYKLLVVCSLPYIILAC